MFFKILKYMDIFRMAEREGFELSFLMVYPSVRPSPLNYRSQFYCMTYAGPRNARPGNARVYSPSSTTAVPFTIT